ITLWNTGLPLTVAGALGWVMPRFISPPETRSHGKVAIAIGASAIVLILISAGLFALVDLAKSARAVEMGGLLLAIEIALRGSILFAVAWVPMLLLCWFNLAQRVEHWRGRDMAARGEP
ncbi:MAG: hypothetical protein AAFO86_02885, partial [Pseudomonadota bacterium]